MITFTELELVLLCAFGFVTWMYFLLRAKFIYHHQMMDSIFHDVAEGKIKIFETENGFDFKEVKK
jgi:hypothetical protein